MTTSFSTFKNKKKLGTILESTRESESKKYERFRLLKILDANYKAADIENIVIKAKKLDKKRKSLCIAC